MANQASITQNLNYHAELIAIRNGAHNDAVQDCLARALTCATRKVLTVPATSIGDVRAKLAMLIEDADDYGVQHLVDADDLALVLADLDRLMGALQ